MFEYSDFATAWLRPPEDFRCAYGTYRARVVGTWTYPGSPSDLGYGHMGQWPGELDAESIELFEN